MNKARVALLLLCIGLFVSGRISAGDRNQDRPKVRTITAFISLSTSDYKRELADTAHTLNTAKKKFEQSGWVVETIRIYNPAFSRISSRTPQSKSPGTFD